MAFFNQCGNGFPQLTDLAIFGLILGFGCSPPAGTSSPSSPSSIEQTALEALEQRPHPVPPSPGGEIPALMTLLEPQLSPNTVAFSPDGKILAAAGHTTNIYLWNLETGDEVAWRTNSWNSIFFHLAWSADGDRMMSFEYLGRSYLWDWKQQKKLREFGKEIVSGQTGAWSHDERRVALTDDDEVVLFDFESGDELRRLVGHTKSVHDVVFASDDRRVITGGDDHTVRIWDVETGAELRQMSHQDVVRSLAVSPDGTRVAAGLHDLYVWNAETGERLHAFPGSCWCVIFSPDGRHLIAGCSGHVEIRNASTGELEATLSGHTDEIFGLALAPDARHLASASYDHTIKIWDVSRVLGTQE